MTMEIRLSNIEMELAAIVGIKRRAESKGSGRPDNHGFDAETSDPWAVDIEGAAAEVAYCKFRNRYWPASIMTFKGADQGAIFQVRHTQLANGSLILREADPDDHYFVLVVGKAPVFKIVGWIKGKEGKVEAFSKAPNNRPPAYFVPQFHLKPFSK